MCSPALGIALGIGGGIIQGIGAAKATSAQAAQMYAQAGQIVAQGAANARDYSNQATIHARQAQLLRVQGSYDAARATEKGQQLIGAQVAAAASSGVALSGSIGDIVKQTGEIAGRDISAMRYSGRAGVAGEQLMQSLYKQRSIDTLRLAGAEAADMVSGAKSVAGSATLAFISPILSAGGTALKSSFA